MENKNGYSVILPENINVHNVASLFEETKGNLNSDILTLDFGNVAKIDSFGLSFLNYLRKNHKNILFLNVNRNIRNLLDTFSNQLEIPENEKKTFYTNTIIEYFHIRFSRFKQNTINYLTLLVDEIHYTFRFFIKKRGIMPGEISHQLFLMGYDSFPIVCLISFLIGVTISITSLGQLHQVGADIYLADLVGFGMIRELVPLMTGIILAGKIGASITAEISTMIVLEEVNALKTMAVIPEQYLMVPRLLAITIALPLLVGMADLVGIMGGVLVGHFFSDIPGNIFFKEVFLAVDLGDFFVGLIKTMVFGWVVVISAGYKGFTVGKGPEGVGIATTQSVVLSISSIIILDCIFALVLY